MTAIRGMANLSSAALTHLAERESRKGLTEDRKLAQESVKAAFGKQLDAQKSAIDRQREESNKRHEAAEERSSGGFWGGLIGAIVGVAAVVAGVVCLCTGVGAPVGAALIGLGAASFGAGSSIGSAMTAGAAADLDAAADGFGDEARRFQLESTAAEKARSEGESRLNEVNQRYRQALHDAQRMREKG